MSAYRKKGAEATPPRLPEPYEFIDFLGSGSYGTVVLARDTTIKDKEKSKVAIKVIAVPEHMDEEAVSALSRELLIHGAIRHRHIVPVHKCFQTQTHVGVIMEYMKGGRLFDLLNDHGPFPENKIRWMFRQLMDAVKYIHNEMNSMHRDIKLENILLADRKKQWPTIYLCDFGFARTRGVQFGPTVSSVGSKNYFAPEILLRTNNDRYDGKIADIFSCGVCFYVLLYGEYPQGKASRDRHTGSLGLKDICIDLPNYQLMRTSNGTKKVPITPACLSLLKHLLEPDPLRRITLDGVWRDPWFRNTVKHR